MTPALCYELFEDVTVLYDYDHDFYNNDKQFACYRVLC